MYCNNRVEIQMSLINLLIICNLVIHKTYVRILSVADHWHPTVHKIRSTKPAGKTEIHDVTGKGGQGRE
jgi:hypothetical protein